jgi:predicted transcriptional regulator
MSITIEVSEETAAAIHATPEGLKRVRALLEEAFELTDEETLSGLQRGLNDIAAGHATGLEESHRRGRAVLL